MTFNAGCWRPPAVVLVMLMLWLSGCATGGFDPGTGVCPPVVEYSRSEQARAADDVGALPEDAVIGEWLADYAVLRDQARVCSRLQAP
ncbi:hypothetical protein [Rhodobacter ferrooxidans]|uniref:Lipoprotein n=1 Tax=Rhodobacter ferrooxidans TaxID=371731 RepID=C8S3Z1_9RHOB|nr:hypothetical protein [Rhodobacter sp. SW2]EEW24253.1 conserved hypothetical protein [Rhodobacter sp. SW2]